MQICVEVLLPRGWAPFHMDSAATVEAIRLVRAGDPPQRARCSPAKGNTKAPCGQNGSATASDPSAVVRRSQWWINPSAASPTRRREPADSGRLAPDHQPLIVAALVHVDVPGSMPPTLTGECHVDVGAIGDIGNRAVESDVDS